MFGKYPVSNSQSARETTAEAAKLDRFKRSALRWTTTESDEMTYSILYTRLLHVSVFLDDPINPFLPVCFPIFAYQLLLCFVHAGMIEAPLRQLTQAVYRHIVTANVNLVEAMGKPRSTPTSALEFATFDCNAYLNVVALSLFTVQWTLLAKREYTE